MQLLYLFFWLVLLRGLGRDRGHGRGRGLGCGRGLGPFFIFSALIFIRTFIFYDLFLQTKASGCF